MVFLYIALGIIGAALIWIIADVIIALKKKPIPDLPDKFLNPGGLSMVYHYLSESDKIPEGLNVDEEYILKSLEPSIEFITKRYDCADFRLQLLFRLYKDCYNYLPDSVRSLIKKVFLDFRYWMDEPGEDSMCIWSENHQLLFSVNEYLAGQEFSDEVFTNAKISGVEHMQRAIKRINYWMEHRYNYGFSEWFSNNYYAEDLAPMANYIEYSHEELSVNRMKMIMDLLWMDVASHSVNNTFVAVSSRMYGDNKSSDLYGNRIRAAMTSIWDKEDTVNLLGKRSEIEDRIISGAVDLETTIKLVGVDAQMMQSFIAMYRKGHYTLPKVIYEIAKDKETAVIKSSSGLGVKDLVSEGLIGQSDNQIMAQLGAETFTNPEVIENTLEYLSRNKMYRNKFVNPFRFIDIKLLRLLRVPRLISLRYPLMTNGIALERGNVYCYRTADYTLITAQAQNVDSSGAQGHIWTANIAPDLAVYTTHPARDDDNIVKHGASPGYWVGNGRQPMSVQHENVNITIYKLPKSKRLLEFHIANLTHAYMPREKFDEFILEYNTVFARRGKVLLAMIANGELKFRPHDAYAAALLYQHDKQVEKLPGIQLEKEFDLVREGGRYHTYVTEISSTDSESLEEFINRIKANSLYVDHGNVKYVTKGTEIIASYDKTFKVNGEDVNLNYKRYDSRYSVTERKAEMITIEHNGNKLVLDYKNNRRELS